MADISSITDGIKTIRAGSGAIHVIIKSEIILKTLAEEITEECGLRIKSFILTRIQEKVFVLYVVEAI